MFWYPYTLGEETVNKFLLFKSRFCRGSYDIIAYFSMESLRIDQVVVFIGNSKCKGFRLSERLIDKIPLEKVTWNHLMSSRLYQRDPEYFYRAKRLVWNS